jgi:dephospho-CoA kinase
MGNVNLILGVTGNIACGKSCVAEILCNKGATLLSADQLAREVVMPGTVLLDELVSQFGTQILTADGSLDRDNLGRRVFADETARLRLNVLLHPAIATLAEERLAELVASGAELIVYEAPLLFEAGAEGRVDKVLVVTINPEQQLRRLIARDHFDEIEAKKRIAAQMSQQEKAARADFLIDNSGSLAELECAVEKLWQKLT